MPDTGACFSHCCIWLFYDLQQLDPPRLEPRLHHGVGLPLGCQFRLHAQAHMRAWSAISSCLTTLPAALVGRAAMKATERGTL